jgi:hypothetical protein
MHHDDCLINHFDIVRILELLSCNYWFPKIFAYVKKYIITCDLCSRAKFSWYLKYDELFSLSISSDSWKEFSCDYIIDLSFFNEFDALLVFIDRFIKMLYIIPCNKITDAPQFACIFLDHIIYLYELPDSFVSDHDLIFISHFWKYLSKFLDVNRRLSISFHSQMDGQMEHMNQIIE